MDDEVNIKIVRGGLIWNFVIVLRDLYFEEDKVLFVIWYKMIFKGSVFFFLGMCVYWFLSNNIKIKVFEENDK